MQALSRYLCAGSVIYFPLVLKKKMKWMQSTPRANTLNLLWLQSPLDIQHVHQSYREAFESRIHIFLYSWWIPSFLSTFLKSKHVPRESPMSYLGMLLVFFKISAFISWKEVQSIKKKKKIILWTWHLGHKYLVTAAVPTTRIGYLK